MRYTGLTVKDTGTSLYIGTAGWSYDDWKGRVYPDDAPSNFRGLKYLAEACRFNTVELNNTFYRPPKPGYSYGWLKDVKNRPDFRFTVKLWKRFTHERDEPWQPGEVRQFREGIGPLIDADKLGALLVQFPWSFRFNKKNQKWLENTVDEFADLPLVVEVRSKAWLGDRALEFLQGLGVSFCNIDQPAYKGNIPLTDYGFGTVGYLRLHGRNYESWFSDDAGRNERYDYLYSTDELDEIQAAARNIAEKVEQIYVIANNHYRGQAPANALQLMDMLTEQQVPRPMPLAEHFDLP
ncbi:MAG: DUF72 domain-containing protein [Planctomycetes bacterium]|nr:DUF72 domain-containing protein [Planctomycetota bacterium]